MNPASASAAWSFRWFFRITQPLIGEIAWKPPVWAASLQRGFGRRPGWLLLLLVTVTTLGFAGWKTWQWYSHLPKPLTVGWIVSLADLPAPDTSFVPQNATVSFDSSVVRLDLIGKDVTSLVTMTPKMKGKWMCYYGAQIEFLPEENWAPSTTYRVTFSPKLFSPQARMETLSKEFHTDPFTVAIGDAIFYVNPQDPSIKQITATLTFSHPVNRTSLEKNLELAMENGVRVFGHSSSAHCSITYDKLDRVAYLRSDNVSVPHESGHALLIVPESVVAARGNAPLQWEQRADVQVPSFYDLFHVASAQAMIVTNSENEPEQALVLITTVGVKTDALAKATRAWILPKPKKRHDPNTDQDVEQWDSGAEVTADVLAKATPVPLIPVPTENEFDTTHSFKLKVPENAALYISVDKGLEAVGGFTLGDKFTTIGQVPPYPREVHIMHDGALLALSGERKLSIESRGVEQLQFELDRVTPASINHLVSQSDGVFQSPVFSNENFDESDICEHIERSEAIAAVDTAKNDYSALDFSEFVDDRDANHGKLGLFILRVLGRQGGNDGGYYKQDGNVLPDPKTHPPKPEEMIYKNGEQVDPTMGDNMLADRRMILITDLGLIVKDNADGTHDVFVQSIKTGEPVDGARIDVLGKNGVPVVTVTTDDNGHAGLPALGDFKREKKPVAYVAHKDDDISFLPFDREDRVLNFSRFDIAGVTGLAPHDLTAFVFADRGIYRPGDTAKLGLIIKQRDWQGKLDGVPLRLDVVDPRGTTVQSRLLKLDASGFLEGTFPTRETAQTGKYQVNCYLVKGADNDTLLGSTTLRVAEFLPDRMKIKATLSSGKTEGWVNGSGLKGLVSLENLYGAAAAGHRVTGKITLDPTQFSFDRYPDFTFIDPYLDPKASRQSNSQDLPEQTTDENGNATFDLSMANLQPSAYRLSFLTEGFEKEGGRSVTAGSEVLVSPRAWLVGTKPDGDLSYVKLNSRRSVMFLAVDPHLNPTSVSHLKLQIVERRFVSVLVQQPNENYAYQSVLKEIPTGEEDIGIPAKGVAWPLWTMHPGDFAARLYDDHGDLVADVRYSVAGSGNESRALEKNAELNAKLSKPEYMPGEEIEVEITAPYTGAGLLTIERDKVYAQAWFQAKTTTSVQKITLPKDFEGNGYLNVAFVRALDSREIYMSPLSYTVLPFKVNQEARHTHIAIDVPKIARPGEPLLMTVTASRPTQAVVYAVDEGILQVAGYELPDPRGYFFRKQALEVGTRQTVDQILPEYEIVKELAAAGGDANEDALAHHLNPFKRKHDAPVAFWSGIVDIGPQAKTFTYNVPDYFAGTIRVMVVANTADAVGSEQAKTQVRGPFIISPNVPTFVAPGDTFDVSVTIANNVDGSGPDAPVKLKLETTDGLEVAQKPADSATIPEGKDASFHWLLKAKDLLGNADITVTAEGGGKTSSLVSHLSIRPPVPYLTTLTTGYFKGDEKQVDLTRQLYPQFRKVTALVSPLPQGLMRGLGDYLENYAYGCTEQLVSKAFPTLVSGETMQQGLPRAGIAQHIAEILDVAASRQNDEGAFGLWAARPDLHFDLPSAHIMHFMTEAKEQGYDVPDDMMKSGLAHLQQDANGTPGDFREARNQAYEIYLLARNGVVVTNAVEHNHRWFEDNAKGCWNDDVAAAYEAATYQLLKDQSQADAMIGQFHLQNGKNRWPEEEVDYDDDLGRAAQYIYLLSRHFPERLKTLTQDDLMTLAYPIMDEDYNTVSSAEAIFALDSYGRAMKESFLASTAEIDAVNGNARKKLDLTPGLYPEAKIDPDTTQLTFKRTADGGAPTRGLFYQITESGFELGAVTTPISDGIEITREYQDKDGKPVTTAKLGEELKVVVRVRSTQNQILDNVAVEDLLPGGFEIVEESVHTGDCTNWGEMEYADVREDRLLVFGTITGDETTITYRIKATNHGTYAVPPVQAAAMYHPKIRARGISGTLTVAD